MKFAHIADCHLGGWREQKIRELGYSYFSLAIDKCIEEKVDFVLLAGDLFNTSLPAIDAVSVATRKLKQLNDSGINVYAIPGSHDFSPTGKTMLEVLEHAGLLVNVAQGEKVEGKLRLKFTVDTKTNVKITGLLGKKGGLDKEYYSNLDYDHLKSVDGYKIFMFHSAIEEMKPEGLERMDAMPVSLLPEGFDYYAGGHVHVIDDRNVGGRENVVFPGPTFPNNFAELEKLGKGNFVIVQDGVVRNASLQLKNVRSVFVDAKDKDIKVVEAELLEKLEELDVSDAIVLIRIKGVLSSGKPTDIDFRQINERLNERGVFFVMKNTSALISKDLEEIKVANSSVGEIENQLIEEHISQSKAKIPVDSQRQMAKQLMKELSAEKNEGEKIHDYEERLKKEVDKVLFE